MIFTIFSKNVNFINIMKLRFLIFFLIVLSCSETVNPEYYENWKLRRKNALYAEDGFLNLAGLYQIEDGKHTMGSAEGNDMLMPNGFPDNFAEFTIKDSLITFKYYVPVLFENKLITDISYNYFEDFNFFDRGSFRWFVHVDSGVIGIRLRNFNHPIQNISPFVGIATQNHFKGRWVVVNNIFYELAFKNSTFPDFLPKSANYNTLNYLFTITHNLRNPNWSVFGEFQTFKNGAYSDELFKFGAAHLISKDIQADLNIGGSLKNTPSLFYFNLGFSKRFDWHIDITDVELKQMKEFKKNQKAQRKAEKDSEKQARKSERKGKTILDFFKRGESSEKKKVRKELKDLKKESKKLNKETKRQNRADRKKNK